MTGENGTPPTPEWSVEPHDCPILDFLAARMRRDQKEPLEVPANIELGGRAD